MSDLIRKHFDYGQLWPLWAACSQKMAELYIPDPTSRIQFGSVFPEKAWTILCKPNSDLIWMAWSGLGQIHPVLKQAGVQKPLAPVSGRMQHARDQFPAFRLGCILPQTAWIMLCKTRLAPVWCWLTVSGFGQTDLVQKQGGVQESSGPLLANASKLIRIGCKLNPACLLGMQHKILSRGCSKHVQAHIQTCSKHVQAHIQTCSKHVQAHIQTCTLPTPV